MSESGLHTDGAITEDQDMDGEGDYNNGEYDEGDDEDVDEEAEAVAKRLGDALWADISKAYAQQGSIQIAEVPVASVPSPQPPPPQPPSPSVSEEGDDEETLANAVQLVLDLSTNMPSLHQELSDATVPGTQDDTLLGVLTELAGTKTVSPELAKTLSTLVQSIADGELFVGCKMAALPGQGQVGEGAPCTAAGKGRLPSSEVE